MRTSPEAIAIVRERQRFEAEVPDEAIDRLFITHAVELGRRADALNAAVMDALRPLIDRATSWMRSPV
jgi:hypothetical protein